MSSNEPVPAILFVNCVNVSVISAPYIDTDYDGVGDGAEL